MSQSLKKINNFSKSLIQHTGEKIITGCLAVVKTVWKVPVIAGKTVGKGAAKVGKNFLDKKLKAKYEKYKNNGFYKTISFLVWMFILSWSGSKIYHSVYQTPSITLHTIIENPSIIGYSLVDLAVIFYFLRDMLRIISWNKQDNIKEQVSFYTDKKDTQKLTKILLSQKISSAQKKELKELFKNCTETYEIRKVYDEVVLSEMDKEAERIIDKYAQTAAIGNLLSPKLSLDYIIIIGTFAKMMLEIAKAYRVKLSISTFFMLLAFGISIAGLAPVLIDYVKRRKDKHHPEGLLANMTDWLIGKFCEATAICGVMSFLGYSIQYVIRPIESHN